MHLLPQKCCRTPNCWKTQKAVGWFSSVPTGRWNKGELKENWSISWIKWELKTLMHSIRSHMEKLCYVRTQFLEVSPDIMIKYTHIIWLHLFSGSDAIMEKPVRFLSLGLYSITMRMENFVKCVNLFLEYDIVIIIKIWISK